jgi:hypothetical protein
MIELIYIWKKNRFIDNTFDTNVYMKKVENYLMVIALYINDCIIVPNDPRKLLPQIKKS